MSRRVWRRHCSRPSTWMRVLSPMHPRDVPANRPNGVDRPAIRCRYRIRDRSIFWPRSPSGSSRHRPRLSSRLGEATKSASRTSGRAINCFSRARIRPRSAARAASRRPASPTCAVAVNPSPQPRSSSMGRSGVRKAKNPAWTMAVWFTIFPLLARQSAPIGPSAWTWGRRTAPRA